MSIKKCRECGQTFSVEVERAFSPESEGFCSEGCRETARKRWREEALRKWREKGKKMLAKWEKSLEKDTEKRKNRINELSSAMRGDDPDAIIKAIKGSPFKRFCRLLWWILKAIPLYIGLVCTVYCAVKFYHAIKPDLERNEKPAAITSEMPPVEDSLGTVNTNATSSGVVAAPVEETATSANE